MDHSTKEKLILACREYLETKAAVVRKAMNGLKEDLENESKSSAGDKYETGREMINIEWNKLSNQLNQYDQLSKILSRIEDQKSAKNVVLGSLVITNSAKFFISIPAGEIKVSDEQFYAVGVKAPISQQLLGKSKGETFIFNGKEFQILEVI
ncbi:transcription elongation factor [Christiangramia sp. SM2212]|uniref:Transcription elongation factor n=1 Tax=Christiangramia sediminicola TaxID=3073267 RepID=A0ABU1ESE0_9FLAO|nr:transcription elongation factor [Christiangramia sp. SM2212]MDR5591307.1 transcription elongation factor [Christiangramia sp. SM2212]